MTSKPTTLSPAIAYWKSRVNDFNDRKTGNFVTGTEHSQGGVQFDTFPSLRSGEKLPVPNLIPVIPVELYGEDYGNVRRALKLLHKARAGKGITEVILWFNCISTTKEHPSKDPEALKKQLGAPNVYKLWLDKLVDTPVSLDFRLRTTLAFRLPGENFNNIRSDYMDALIMDPRFSNPSAPEDPVVAWIDSNMPFLAAEALDEAEKAAREKLGWLIKTNLQLTSEQLLSVFSIGGLTMAERVAMVYSVVRRDLEWNLGPTDDRGYVEEPGMAMLLSTYRESRGIATSNPLLGESRTLVERVKQNLDITKIPPVYNLRNARVGKSNRRFVWMAERYPAWMLAGSEEGDDYESFTTQKDRDVPLRTDPITTREVFEMARGQVGAQHRRTGTGLTFAQAKRISKIIQLCGFATGWYDLAA